MPIFHHSSVMRSPVCASAGLAKTGSFAMPRAFAMICAFAVTCSFAAWSAQLDIAVLDADGKPVKDAVVYALSESGPQLAPKGATAILDQIDKEFVPGVLPVQTGTLVRFPNQDNIRHNVYSFSQSKSFSLDLYKGEQASPVLFDKAGAVVLGCNIHDNMVAHILVVDTPYFSRSDGAAPAHLRNLPGGAFEVRVWHPRQTAEVAAQTVKLGARDTQPLTFRIALKPEPPRRGRK